METFTDLPITVAVPDRSSMEDRLDEAVAVAQAVAIRNGRQGILVTRHSYNLFTVDLSDEVPFGLSREKQECDIQVCGVQDGFGH